ncbi:MAG: ribosomal protein S18-alanine N-acetyltransferase [Gammaproteobacteria bacterium]|nr:ribosomal protein S18-alanine N-acetyltransferase [Gammaproteobacteria bacterium]
MSAMLEDGVPEFRPMREEDLDAVMEIEKAVYPSPWTVGIFRDCMRVGYYCQVLERNGLLEAYGALSHGAGEAHILNLCVHPKSQRQGLGRIMLKNLIDAAKRLSAEIVLLEVRPSNKVAVRLYLSMGFNEAGCRKDYYPHEKGREDALIFAMNL